jgi:hypothetical protein
MEASAPSVTNEETSGRPKQTRVSRKRTRFKGCPRPAIAVRGLWEQASTEEKRKAHATCMAILEYWLGKATKGQVAERLEVPPLRVWQLSQQALSGMLAGLLRQPRTRKKVSVPPATPEEDPKLLKRRVVELERKLAHTEDLVRVLKDLPWAKQAAAPATSTKGKGGRDARGKPVRARRGEQASKRNPAARRTNPRRRRDAGAARGDQGGARGDAPHAAELDA